MRISKGYWLWGQFPSRDKNFLNEIKAKVQTKLKSPFFETHITLAGPYLNISNVFLNELKNLAENHSAILRNADGYDYKQEVFRSFYIPIENSQQLKELRRNICKLNNFDLANKYSPHISLSYGNHEIKEKKELISNLPEINQSIRMSKIALVEAGEDINLWKILESFDLNKTI